MSRSRKTLVTAVETLELEPIGTWAPWTPEVANQRPDLVEAVQGFQPLDHPAGQDAARWLRERALANDGSTKTYLLEHEGCVQGYFACCAGTVTLTRKDSRGLDVPYRRQLPAFILAWVARHAEGSVPGIHLVVTAYGLARDLAQSLGRVAFALDPRDKRVARLWQDEPYGFQQCVTDPDDRTDRPPRLWLPLR
jgi:hypothetical protein